jgi:hypothetical protein
MKNISTGFGLCVAAAAALAYPFVSSLAPSANASAVTAAASAVSTAAAGQAGPTIVWYGTNGDAGAQTVYRAWSDGRIEMSRVRTSTTNDWQSSYNLWCTTQFPPCASPWFVISDPAQGLTFRSDVNFDAKVDGADLGQLLTDWGNAPRQDIPPSDCPLNLVNP